MSLIVSPEFPMAKKRMGRPPKGRNDVSVKLDAVVASRARYVARAAGKTMAEYLTEITEDRVNRDFKKVGESLKD